MRNILLLILLIANIQLIVAQSKIKVKATTEKMSQGYKEGLTVDIPEANAKDVEKLWKKQLKDYNAKVSNTKGEIFADDASVKELGENTVDIYAIVEEQKDFASLTVFFDLGGAFLSASQHSAKYEAMEKVIEKIAIEAAKEAVGSQIDAADKALKDLKGDQEKLIKENEKLKSNIEGWKEDIKKAENDLVQNGKDQEAKKSAITEQQKMVEALKNKLNAIK